MPGPLTEAELLALWQSAVDAGYAEPLLADEVSAAVIQQGLAQHARVSLSIDRSTQQLFLLPWSGQTDEPAAGEQRAVVLLEATRAPTAVVDALQPIVLDGLVVEHDAVDFGGDGPVSVDDGLRYAAAESLVIGPGQMGPELAMFVADKPGPSYNFPLPGTLTRLSQPGETLSSGGAASSAIVSDLSTNVLELAPEPDVLTTAQRGQYVLLESTSPAFRQVRRVVSVDGLVVRLDTDAVLRATGAVTGTFEAGEVVTWTGGEGLVLWASATRLAVAVRSGQAPTGTLTGLVSGATGPYQVEIGSTLPASSAVTWRVLSWVELGVAVTNPSSPAGGRLGVLDELGIGMMLPRATAEPDDTYRERLAASDDVVSPNALLRAANRVLAPLGFAACLREPGTAKLPGLYFDVDPAGDPARSFAFDMPDEQPHRWKLLLDYLEFRGFFLIGVPEMPVDQQGSALDVNALDHDAFFDGESVASGEVYAAVWSALARVKGGGVSFDLYIERDDCT